MHPARPVIDAILAEPPYRYEGVRKIVTNISWTVPTLPVVAYEDLGYTSAKFKQLKRNYWDEENATAFRALMKKREKHGFSAVAIHPHGAKKREDSMGYCIDTLVALGNPKDGVDVTIFYRSTEVTKKFAGDLCFLPWVFSELGLEPKSVTFQFAAAYFSGVFMGTLFRMEKPLPFMSLLRRTDPILFNGGMRFLYRAILKRDQKFPYSPEDREHKLLWEHLSTDTIREIKGYLDTHMNPEYRKKYEHL